jgi:hypothetical protein
VPKPRLSELVPSAAQFDLTDIAFLKATSIVSFFSRFIASSSSSSSSSSATVISS